MAVPSYSSDLVDIIVDPTTSSGWSALGGGASGLASSGETDYYVQGSSCMSKAAWASAIKGMVYNNGSGVSVAAGSAVWVWMTHHTPAALGAESAGGLRVTMGNSTAAYREWYVRGSDTISYGAPWVMGVIDPTVSADNTSGSPNGTLQYLGGQANLPSGGPTKGSPFGIDAIRYGKSFTCTNGSLADGYASFSGAVTYNDNNARVYGQIEQGLGTYIARGNFLIGTSGTACEFSDSNRNILFDRLTKVSSTFNQIAINNASSVCTWSGINISQLLGSPQTATRASFSMLASATVTIDSCSFSDMGTFTFLSSATVTGSQFRRCDQITLGGASFSECTFSRSNNATAGLVAASPSHLAAVQNSTVISPGSGHGAVITGTAANITLTGITWTGFAGSDGSSGNEAIYVNIASGSMTITISGGTVPSIRTAGAAVTVVSGAVSVAVKTINTSNTAISSANVLLKADSGGPFPHNASVTITNSGTTATVSHASHAMSTNDQVLIKGASLHLNNGVHSITVLDANSYYYVMGSAPGSNPTGTILSTYVLIYGLTDGSGNINMSRVFPSNQPVVGWARKSSASPYYKTAGIAGTVLSASGLSSTVQLLPDE